MKNWSEWSFWSRGAMIALALCLFFIFFKTILTPHYFYIECGGEYCVMSFATIVNAVFNFTLIPLWNSLIGQKFLEYPTFLYFSALIYYFFVGAFLGLIYGKIKHGKHTVHPPKVLDN